MAKLKANTMNHALTNVHAKRGKKFLHAKIKFFLEALFICLFAATPYASGIEFQGKNCLLNECIVTALATNEFLIQGKIAFPAESKITIETKFGDIIRQYRRNGRNFEVMWDGRDSFGNMVKSGSFKVFVEFNSLDGVSGAEKHEIGCAVINPSPANENLMIYPENALMKVCRGNPMPVKTIAASRKKIKLAAAANEFVAFQLVTGARNKSIKLDGISLSSLESANGTKMRLDMKVYKEHFMAVDKPSYPILNNFINKDNGIFQDMGLEVPQQWPDQLIPVKYPVIVEPGIDKNITPLWLDFITPRDAKPGMYCGILTVKTSEGPKEYPFELEIYDFALEDKCMPSLFPLDLDLVKADRMTQEKYFYWMVEKRMCPTLPAELTEPGMEKIANDPRLPYFHTKSRTNKLEYLKPVIDKGQREGWLNKLFIYTYDEPERQEYPNIVKFRQDLNKIAPNHLPILITFCVGNPYPEALINSIGIWCPHYQLTGKNFDSAKFGGKRWWYINPLLMLDCPAIFPRVAIWKQVNYNIEGLLLWHTNCWPRFPDPYGDCNNSAGEGNGNGILVYPGEPVGVNGPVSSLRLETLRDAIEDYFYLQMLDKSIKAAAVKLKLDAGTANRMAMRRRDEFTGVMIEPLESATFALEEQRQRLAYEISQLNSGLPVLIETSVSEADTFGGMSTRVKLYTLPGADVKIQGKTVKPENGAFNSTQPLVKGFNKIEFEVTCGGKTVKLSRIICGGKK